MSKESDAYKVNAVIKSIKMLQQGLNMRISPEEFLLKLDYSELETLRNRLIPKFNKKFTDIVTKGK